VCVWVGLQVDGEGYGFQGYLPVGAVKGGCFALSRQRGGFVLRYKPFGGGEVSASCFSSFFIYSLSGIRVQINIQTNFV